ncbi:hypothetical protein BpHYR1_038839 [Brachionus plicatilis]|uniref:Uncharacterized protein n=1 Tax=Brachionus plicatilis TaxID=10195 RepID=A0A3M7SAC3_BRAPC|nr:hypothetical protein BpHYR1_038839 [Brachionus plicatilis]
MIPKFHTQWNHLSKHLKKLDKKIIFLNLPCLSHREKYQLINSGLKLELEKIPLEIPSVPQCK